MKRKWEKEADFYEDCNKVLSEDGAELSSGCFYFGYSLNICCILRRNVFNEQECSANDRILGQRVLIDVCFWDADGFSFIDRLCTGIDTLAKKILNKVTGIPKTPQQALADCISIYCVLLYKLGIWACYRCSSCERGRQKVKGLHFPLLVAAAYGGEIIRGPSSIPLVSATPGNFMEKLGLPLTPVGDTLYSSWNLVMTAIIVIMLFIVYFNMKPPANEIVEYSEKEQENQR